jgi:hypothetical protein
MENIKKQVKEHQTLIKYLLLGSSAAALGYYMFRRSAGSGAASQKSRL